MVPDIEKPRVTEIHVRIDCNGCVQKIKKALHGINGIYDVYIDFPQQKLTVVGWADPERIVKAIKKTRKIATICSHKEAEPPAPAEGEPAAAPQAENPPPPEAPAPEAAPPAEPAKEPPPPQASENAAKEASPPPAGATAEGPPAQPPSPSEPKDVEEIHIIHHHPHNYGYSNQWNMYSSGHGFRPQEAPYHVVTHSYNTHRPSPYVTEYEYQRSPPRNVRYSRTEHYVDDYHYNARDRENGDGTHITSMFSDENPNACRIV